MADHIVLKPNGFVFAPHPAVTDTDRDKYCVHRIVDFYTRQPTDYADYFLAAWQYHHRRQLGKSGLTLTGAATESAVSPKYLKMIWAALTGPSPGVGPLNELQTLWRALPVPQKSEPVAVRPHCVAMRYFVIRERQKYVPQPDKDSTSISGPVVDGLSAGSQPITLMMNRRLAEHRRRPAVSTETSAVVAEFCRIFPDTFYVSERGRVYVEKGKQNKGRLLSAGFHLMAGYFRDDEPLIELILDESEQRELDTLWGELNCVTAVPARQYRDFLFFERTEPPQLLETPEFDFARPEVADVTSSEKRARLAMLYLKKIRDMDVREPIEHYFADISTKIQQVEATRKAAEPSHLEALLEFAERAYRRPLSQSQRESLIAFYDTLRDEQHLSHEDAIRDSVVSVLMSSYFCYRIDLPPDGVAAGPLSGYALASRLSYFLWSSMPDDELLDCAANGELQRPDVLIAQTRRMLQDTRSRGLATEFGANWLGFRQFEQFSRVDRDRFPRIYRRTPAGDV